MIFYYTFSIHIPKFIDAKILALYSVNIDLIPRPNSDGCPNRGQYKTSQGLDGSCSCEDHCSWDMCRIAVAPTECLKGTYSEWQWDYVKKAWVAQVTQGNIVLITMKILKIKF